MGKIYVERDLDKFQALADDKMDKAIVAAAFKIRNDGRSIFKQSKGEYKHPTNKYNPMTEGLMVGKLAGHKVKVHALGARSGNTWKARLFVGGALRDKQGLIFGNDSLDKSVKQNDGTLSKFINNAINKLM